MQFIVWILVRVDEQLFLLTALIINISRIFIDKLIIYWWYLMIMIYKYHTLGKKNKSSPTVIEINIMGFSTVLYFKIIILIKTVLY